MANMVKTFGLLGIQEMGCDMIKVVQALKTQVTTKKEIKSLN